ncbi:Transposase DDE domain-containing protein [Antarctobacter heliothermus]|uniref:Transposase DDE domain-containing protein n=1 Tax=Antarctobacter heliothermus TaxID=74033 RepID=A0A239CTT3_9RHOB|nr:Transposase DDE domain-containing protein [Antarctobacter heliothermus]
MSRPIPPSYKTKNWPAYNEALKQRGSLTIWFDRDMTWVPPPTGKRGRQPQYSDAAIQTCLTMKVLFGMALRQTTGFVESLLRLVGLDWAVPDFSTLSRRQKTLAVTIPYRGSQGPLNLLIDSTGIKAEGEGEWHARKHGGAKRLVPSDSPCSRWLPRLGILARRYDGMGAAVGDGVMALARIVGSVGGDRSYLDVGGDLVEQLGQHGRVPDVASGDLDGSDLQRLFVDADVDLAP